MTFKNYAQHYGTMTREQQLTYKKYGVFWVFFKGVMTKQ